MSALYVLRNFLGDDDLLILLLGRCCSIYRYPLRPALRVLPPGGVEHSAMALIVEFCPMFWTRRSSRSPPSSRWWGKFVTSHSVRAGELEELPGPVSLLSIDTRLDRNTGTARASRPSATRSFASNPNGVCFSPRVSARASARGSRTN